MRIRHLVAVLLALASPASLGQSNAGSVSSFQTLNGVQGGFGPGAPGAGDTFGHAAVSLGDLNGDGIGDVVVGESRDDQAGFDAGAIWVLFLNPIGSIQGQQKITAGVGGFVGPLASSDEFGSALAAPGDIDGDGVPDIAVGTWGDDDGGTGRGAVWILFMNPNGTVKAEQKISDTAGNFQGTLANGDAFGISVAGIGDRNGDGIPDLIVGARFDDDGGLNRGAVYLLTLDAAGMVKSHQKISATSGGFTGTLTNDDVFGSGVAGIGDLDGDGTLDVAVGAMQDDDGGSNNGAVWILLLRPPTALTAVKAHHKISLLTDDVAIETGTQFGSTVGAIGDIDDDGVPDLGVGARLDGLTSPGGTVWICLLNGDGSVKKAYPINEAQGNFGGVLNFGDEFGNAISGMGDHNGDGVDDLLVGAWLDDDAGQSSGSAFVLRLSPTCPDVIEEYGDGCPGSGGFVPRVTTQECPVAGSGITLLVDGGLGGASGLILLGFGQASVPLGATGCSLHLATVFPASIPLLLGGGGPGNGAATLFGTVPPIAAGFSFNLQAFVADPATPHGYSTTNGLEVRL